MSSNYRPNQLLGGDGNRVPKPEKGEADKLYTMIIISDTLKCSHGRLVPLNAPQRASRLNLMFSPPNGVAKQTRNKTFYTYLIQDIEKMDVKLNTGYGPSRTLERQFIDKDCSIQEQENMKNIHCHYAVNNCIFLKVNNVLLLSFASAPLLNFEGTREGMNKYLADCRKRWYAANLLRLPTSPQVIAAQLLRNHARIYSEDVSVEANPAEYHKAVQRLIHFCTGLERALLPEQGLPVANHMRLSWHRIRRRVLERMLEEVNKLNAATEKRFMSAMPFNIRTIPGLVAQIRVQMGICDELWKKENEGEIMLSDGPDSDMEQDDMEGDESMGGEEEQQDERLVNRQIQQSQHKPPIAWAPSADQLPSDVSRMNQLYNHYHKRPTNEQHQQSVQLQGALSAQQRVSMVGSMGGAAAGPSNESSGMDGLVPPSSTPRSSNGGEREGRRMLMRKQQHLVDSTSTPYPSTSSTFSNTAALSHKQAPAPVAPWTIPTAGPSTVPPTASPSLQQQQQQQQTPSNPLHPPFPQPGVFLGMPQMTQTPSSGLPPQSSPMMGTPIFSSLSSLSNTPQLLMVGPDGTVQSIPTIVYVKETDKGLVQITPPNPQPKFLMTLSSMGRSGRGRRSLGRFYSGPVKKRRVSREEKKGGDNEESGDEGNVEKNNGGEQILQGEKDREMKDMGRKEEQESYRNKEEEDRLEEKRKTSEEEVRIEMKRRHKKEKEISYMAQLENVRLAEEGRRDGNGTENRAGKESGVEEKKDETVTPRENEEETENEKGKDKEKGTEVDSSIGTSSNEHSMEKMMGEMVRPMEESQVVMAPVTVPPPPPPPREEDGDSDVEIVFQTIGEKRKLSEGYCEVLDELHKVKKESSGDANNEVIFVKQKNPTPRNLQYKVSANPQNRGTLKDWIKEALDKVKDEETIPKEVKEEMMDDSVYTGMADVKSEVKEEEITEEKKEKEAIVTMIERSNGENQEMEETGELDLITSRDDADMERPRSVIEAMTREDSAQIPLIVASLDSTPPTDVVPSIAAATSSSLVEMQPIEAASLSMLTGASVPAIPLSMETEKETPGGMSTISTPSPRPAPIRVSSQSIKEGNEERIPPRLETRLSAETMAILDRSDSLLSPYLGRMKEMEGTERVKGRGDQMEKDNEKEKKEEEDRDVEVIEEVSLNETTDPVSGLSLRFHAMRGEAATLSKDRKRAIREESIDSYSKAVVFTNRPLFKGERVNLRVVEISPDWKGRLRLGLTTKNPIEFSSRNAIPRQLKNETGDGHFTYMFDSGVRNTVDLDTVVSVELSEKGDELKYAFNGVDMGTLGGGLQIIRPMWMSVDIYGFVKGVEIVESAFLPQEPNEKSLMVVQSEVNKEEGEEKEEEIISQSIPVSSQNAVENEQSSTISVVTQIVQEKKLEEKNLVDTVEKLAHEGVVEDTEEAVATLMEVMLEAFIPQAEKGEEEIIEATGGEDIGLTGIMEMEIMETDEPPKKKMRIETSEGNVQMEEKTKDGNQDNGYTLEEGEEGMDVIEVPQSGDGMSDEGASEFTDEMEGEVREVTKEDGESIEVDENESVEVSLNDQKKGASIVMKEGEKESFIPIESIVEEGMEMEERMEMEEMDLPPPTPSLMGHRLFGQGCLPFDRTLDAKEKTNLNDEEKKDQNEEKMEDDDDMGVFCIRGRSLFGSGSVSIDSLIQNMKNKSE